MKEREIEALLRNGVKQLGGRAYKWGSLGNAGVPDRIVVFPGGVVHFVELKQEHGKLTRLQTIQQKRLKDLNATVFTLYGLDAVKQYLEEVKEMRSHGVYPARVSEVLH